MKQIIASILVVAALASCGGKSPEDMPQKVEKEMQESAMKEPRFKMMPTSNIHILLKWDTRTGRVWMTQYGLMDTPSGEEMIPQSKILLEEESWNGRFELYPTQNIFNFIMIDTYNGDTYQVQWSPQVENCFVVPISE